MKIVIVKVTPLYDMYKPNCETIELVKEFSLYDMYRPNCETILTC